MGRGPPAAVAARRRSHGCSSGAPQAGSPAQGEAQQLEASRVVIWSDVPVHVAQQVSTTSRSAGAGAYLMTSGMYVGSHGVHADDDQDT